MTLVAIDAGAEDFEAYQSTVHIYSPPDKLEELRKILVEQDATISSSELAMLPKNTITLDEKGARQTLRLLDSLEELEDVQRVFSNADFPDEVLEGYGQE